MTGDSKHRKRIVHYDNEEGARLLQAIARQRNCSVPGALRQMIREEADRLGLTTRNSDHPEGHPSDPPHNTQAAETEADGRMAGARYRRIALVSRNYRLTGKNGRWDLSGDYAAINAFCDEQGCDTILYALWTWDRASPGSHSPDFEALRNVHRILIEESDLGALSVPPGVPVFQKPKVIAWQRSIPMRVISQRFARSVDGTERKLRFLEDLREGNRTVGRGVIVACGETNICSTGASPDRHGFLPWLAGERAARGTHVLLNPVHNYMKRREMTEKRRKYSEVGYAVLSVWNWGRWDATGKGEPNLPWTFHQDGVDRTEAVEIPPLPPTLRQDLRIGIVNLAG